MSIKLQPHEAKLPMGPKRRHGGYTFMATGRIPDDKREIERYLTGIRIGYVLDIGPKETDLTTGQIVLLDKLITLTGVNRCIEVEALKAMDIRGMEQNYNTRNNQIIKICLALGIEQKTSERIPTAAEMSDIILAEAEGGKNGA